MIALGHLSLSWPTAWHFLALCVRVRASFRGALPCSVPCFAELHGPPQAPWRERGASASLPLGAIVILRPRPACSIPDGLVAFSETLPIALEKVVGLPHVERRRNVGLSSSLSHPQPTEHGTMQLSSARGPCAGRGSQAWGAFASSAASVPAGSRGAAGAGHSLHAVTLCGQLGRRPCPVCVAEPWSGRCRALSAPSCHPSCLFFLSRLALFSATSSGSTPSCSRPWLAGVASPVTHTAYKQTSSSLAPEPYASSRVLDVGH